MEPSHALQHLFDARQMASLKEAVRRVKEGTSAVLLQSGLDERWWSDSMECHYFLPNVQDFLTGRRRRGRDDSENPFKGPIIPVGAMVDYHPISPRDQAKMHQFGKKLLPGIFLGYELIAGGIWKDILMADLEELRKLDATDFYPRRIIAKEMLTRKKDDMFILPIADGTAKLLGKVNEFREPSLRQESPVRSEDLSGEVQGESEEFRPAEPTDDAQAHADLWSIQGDFICRHHSEPRVQVYVPKEETFPIPLKCIDVTRSAHTDLDVMQEKRTDDFRNVDSNKHLSRFLERIHKVHSTWKKNLQKVFMWFGRNWQRFRRLPDQIMCGQKFRRKLGKLLRIEKDRNGQGKNRSSTLLEDWKEFTFYRSKRQGMWGYSQKCEEKTGRPVAPAMPCKGNYSSITKVAAVSKIGEEKRSNTMFGWIVESHETTRQRA